MNVFIGSECLLTPERSIEIQNSIGADIIMQLDDVVSSTVKGARVEEAMHRYRVCIAEIIIIYLVHSFDDSSQDHKMVGPLFEGP